MHHITRTSAVLVLRDPQICQDHTHKVGRPRGECWKELEAGARSPPFARGLAESAVMSSLLPSPSSCLFFAVTALGVPPRYFAPQTALIQSFPRRAGTTEGSPSCHHCLLTALCGLQPEARSLGPTLPFLLLSPPPSNVGDPADRALGISLPTEPYDGVFGNRCSFLSKRSLACSLVCSASGSEAVVRRPLPGSKHWSYCFLGGNRPRKWAVASTEHRVATGLAAGGVWGPRGASKRASAPAPRAICHPMQGGRP